MSKRNQKTEGRRQRAEGRRQRTEGRRQRAEGRRQRAEGRRQRAEDGRQKARKGKRRVTRHEGRSKAKQRSIQASSEQIRAITAELEKLAEAEAQTDIFEKYPRIQAAWEKAIARHFEAFFKENLLGAGQPGDLHHISLSQIIEITGRGRRTIYDWIGKGLPRNADGSFDLVLFLKWFEKYTIRKLPPQAVATAVNPLQAAKAQRLEIDLARVKNQLLDRNEVMAGQLARHQNLINSLNNKAEELALISHGQPQDKIAEILNNFFDELLGQQCQVPAELQLPPAAEKMFAELLENLRTED